MNIHLKLNRYLKNQELSITISAFFERAIGKMPEVRFHGRGGQGAVIASRVLAEAAFLGGHFVQAFPAFGLERRGAPVLAFTRIDHARMTNHSQIHEPDAVVVLDSSLLKLVNVQAGLKKQGIVIINSELPPAQLIEIEDSSFKAATVNANAIALGYRLGSRTQPIVNTAILGALAKTTGIVTIDDVARAIKKNIPIKTDANIEACRKAYEQTVL